MNIALDAKSICHSADFIHCDRLDRPTVITPMSPKLTSFRDVKMDTMQEQGLHCIELDEQNVLSYSILACKTKTNLKS
jgi:hypothetical protein